MTMRSLMGTLLTAGVFAMVANNSWANDVVRLGGPGVQTSIVGGTDTELVRGFHGGHGGYRGGYGHYHGGYGYRGYGGYYRSGYYGGYYRPYYYGGYYKPYYYGGYCYGGYACHFQPYH